MPAAAALRPPAQLPCVSRLVHSHDPRHSGKFGKARYVTRHCSFDSSDGYMTAFQPGLPKADEQGHTVILRNGRRIGETEANEAIIASG